jgi:outer membrane protein
MYKTLTFIFALGLLIAAPLAQAASGRVGVVDVQQVLAKSHAGQAAQTKVRAYGKKQQAWAKHEQTKLKKEHDTIEKNASIQTKTAQQKAMKTFQGHVQAYQTEGQKRQQAFQKERQKVLQPLQSELYTVIRNYASRHGYTLILDKSATIYSKSGADVTTAILKAFNAAEAKK